MQSLFRTKVNGSAFLLMVLLLRFLFFEADWLSFFALVISLHQFMLLFASINHVIPVRYLFGCFMCLQFFIGPALAYNGLDMYQYFMYQMRVSSTEYYAYMLPAVVMFIAGLHLRAGKLRGERVDHEGIKEFVRRQPLLPATLIGIGLSSSLLSSLAGGEFAFVLYVVGGLKFIGLFLMVIGGRLPKIFPLVLVMGSIISTSLVQGMFHDLLTWTVFTVAVFAWKYKFPFSVKLSGLLGFVLIVAGLQVLKDSYRGVLRSQREEGSLETFAKVAEEEGNEEPLLSAPRLAKQNVRINQGFIITNIMRTVPEKIRFENGAELYKILEAAILPRVLAPDKLKAGDQAIFTKYSGMHLRPGTSMGLSAPGDFYINFGIFGGWICMFLYGLMFSAILNFIQKKSAIYPVVILFAPLIFYYPIRPDCELQTSLGHLVKSSIIVAAIIFAFKGKFRLVRIPFNVKLKTIS